MWDGLRQPKPRRRVSPLILVAAAALLGVWAGVLQHGSVEERLSSGLIVLFVWVVGGLILYSRLKPVPVVAWAVGAIVVVGMVGMVTGVFTVWGSWGGLSFIGASTAGALLVGAGAWAFLSLRGSGTASRS
jgi:hypothetical protein